METESLSDTIRKQSSILRPFEWHFGPNESRVIKKETINRSDKIMSMVYGNLERLDRSSEEGT